MRKYLRHAMRCMSRGLVVAVGVSAIVSTAEAQQRGGSNRPAAVSTGSESCIAKFEGCRRRGSQEYCGGRLKTALARGVWPGFMRDGQSFPAESCIR